MRNYLVFMVFFVACATSSHSAVNSNNSGGGTFIHNDAKNEVAKDSQKHDQYQEYPDPRPEKFVYDPCGPGPTMIDEGLFAMFGCSFLNHAYKIKHNGTKIEGNFKVCGSDNKCIKWLEYECGNFLLCNDGKVDIIISKLTGSVNTHNKSHQMPDQYPDQLELPLEILPTSEPAPWNKVDY